MALTTNINGIPYPENTDTTNYPTAFDNLADQIDTRLVARFASAAARDAAITSPIAGQMCFIQKSSGAYDLQIYRAGAWADMIWPTLVLKTTDEPRTNTTTLSPSDELLFFAQANSTYIIECRLMFRNSATDAADAKFGVYGPAGATAPGAVSLITPTLETSSINTQGTWQASINLLGGSWSVGVFNSSSTSSYVDTRIKVLTSTTAGNVGINWAQNAASANSTVLRSGSWLRYYKIA